MGASLPSILMSVDTITPSQLNHHGKHGTIVGAVNIASDKQGLARPCCLLYGNTSSCKRIVTAKCSGENIT